MMTLARRALMGAMVTVVLGAAPVLAAAPDQQNLVDRARATLDTMKNDPNMGEFRNLLGRAKGVLVVPQLIRAGFFFGAEGGEGVLLGHGGGRVWSYPAFYTVAAASFGLQIGAQMSEVVLLIMTDGGMQRLMEDKVTLGGDLSVAVGPIGAGVEARTTTNVDADVYAFARSQGIFGGLTIKGGGIIPANEANASYYGRPVTPRQIVFEQRIANPGADTLRRSLGEI